MLGKHSENFCKDMKGQGAKLEISNTDFFYSLF